MCACMEARVQFLGISPLLSCGFQGSDSDCQIIWEQGLFPLGHPASLCLSALLCVVFDLDISLVEPCRFCMKNSLFRLEYLGGEDQVELRKISKKRILGYTNWFWYTGTFVTCQSRNCLLSASQFFYKDNLVFISQETVSWDWRDGLVSKSAHCYRRPSSVHSSCVSQLINHQ